MTKEFFSKIIFVAYSVVAASGMAMAQADLTPQAIVQKVDEVRNPSSDYTTMAQVASYKPNRPLRAATYEVFIKGLDKTLVKTLKPQTDEGRMLLMVGQVFWAFFPEVSKPIRISLQERLIGDVSNGDIARTNFSGDYNSSLVRSEDIDGKKYFVLELTAKNDNTTYGKITLWVEEDNFWPLKAEFYAISGHFLKTCSYEDYKILGGQMRPSRIVIKDAIVNGQYSTIDYNEMKIMDIPEKYFTKEYLKKMIN